MMMKNILKAGTSVTLAAAFLLVAGLTLLPQYSFAADGDGLKSKLRPMQDGNVISVHTGADGTAGLPVDCVGGIEDTANADSMKCYLISDEEIWASDYKTDPSVIMQEGSAIACPGTGVFEANKECFVTTFDSGSFSTQGEYRFVAEFYEGDTLIDIARQDYRLLSFFVLPESAIGAVALVGSSLVVFGAYRFLAGRKTVAA
jgi:hypothetical protein